MSVRLHLCLATALLLFGPVVHAQSPHPLAIVGGTVIDVSNAGRSTHDLRDAVIIVRDGRIAEVGPRRSVTIPAGAEIVDASGGFIIPGLHDVFATLNTQGQANAYLLSGVTSIVGIDEPDDRRGPLWLNANPGPRIQQLEQLVGYDGSALPPGTWSVGNLIDRGRQLSNAELIADMDARATRGIKVLLLYYTLSPEQVRAAAAHAREIGVAAIGELGATRYAEAIDAGVMAFVHTSRYSLDLAPEPLRTSVARSPFGPPRRIYYEFLTGLDPKGAIVANHAKRLAAGHTALIPTSAMEYLRLPGHQNPWDGPVAAQLDPRDIHLPADRQTGEQVLPANAVRDGYPKGSSEHLLAIEAQYCQAGATYLTGSGTDAFGTMPGISLHIELGLLVRDCLTPRQALAAATSNVNAAFNWKTTGEIKRGYDADLVVLDADPTIDIANATRVRHVVLAGKVIDLDAMRQHPAAR
jgi:hypothetical protein